MSNSTTFTDWNVLTGTGTLLSAAWHNDVNTTVFVALGDGSTNPPTTAAQVITNLNLPTLSALTNAFTGNVTFGGTAAITGATTLSSTLAVTGGVTFSGTLDVIGHVTVEGVTSTGATGTGKFVFDTSPSLSSPTFTGTPVAPTPTVLDNTTKVATTAFVQAAMQGQYLDSKIQPVTATVATNALTVGLNPTTLDFRSTTLTTGVPNTRSVPAALSLTVPSGATLGTVNAVSARLLILAIDNAGTVELAIINQTGAGSFDESGLISTTTISAAATSATLVYSAAARTNVPYRIVGFLDITEATAGTWATGPTLVQGLGGTIKFNPVSVRGWHDVKASRGIGSTYTNTHPYEIELSATVNTTASAGQQIYTTLIDAYGTLTIYGSGIASAGVPMLMYVKIPSGATYNIGIVGGGTSTIVSWLEYY